MCTGVAELSEHWTADLEVQPIQVRTFYFYSSPTIKIILIRRNPVEIIFIIRREYKPEDVFRLEVATNIQLNRKFPPLFII